MDPVSLVAGALAAGASQGLAESAIGDLYRRLKARLGGRSPADADLDDETVALAQQILTMVDLRGAKGVQVGDHGVQVNVAADAGDWPRRHGTPPRLADSFQPRTGLRYRVTADGGTVVASGNGGVGKTQLATVVFRESRRDFAAWITATSRDAVLSSYAEAATVIDPRWVHLPPEQAARQFLSWLGGTQRSWLVVLDDIADPADLQGLWPQGPAGAVLVTTRRRDLRVGARVEVEVFTPEESLAYLTEALTGDLPRSDVVDEAADLATDLGHLPVALSQAAAVIAYDGITCADYRSRYDLSSLRPVDDYEQPVALTWQAAIERADAMEPVGIASKALELAAVLDPNGIPQEVWTEESDDMRRALRNLHALHLVTHDPNGGPTSVRIHALVQKAVLHGIPDVTPVVRQAADRLVEIWPETENDPRLSQSLRTNAQALTAQDGLWVDGVHGVRFMAGRSLGEAGLLADAVTYHEDLHRAAEVHLAPDHPDTLVVRHNLACWRGHAGDAAGAAQALQAVLTDRLRTLGPDDPRTLATRSELAFWRGHAGDAASAIDALQAVLTDRLRILGPDHSDTLVTRGKLARWRGEAGDPAGAATDLRQILTDHLRVLGPDHPYTLMTRHHLAYWHGAAGDPSGAVADLREILADHRQVLGPDHPETLRLRGNLAHWRGEAGEAEAAAAGLAEVLADQRRVLGEDHPDTAKTRWALKVRRDSR